MNSIVDKMIFFIYLFMDILYIIFSSCYEKKK